MLIISIIRMFFIPILISVSVVVGALVGAYFWLPLWYGWLSLISGLIGVVAMGFLAYHGYLFITFQGPYKQKKD